jgi:hypothetical protein
MRFQPNVFDVWTWRRSAAGVEYLLLHTSPLKAERFFGGGRFWQIPSHYVADGETVVQAVERQLATFRLAPREIWAAEYVYNIYNRRFEAMQMVAVYAARVEGTAVVLDPDEHSEYRWCGFAEAMRLVNFRGLKEGLASVREFVTERETPMPELKLR